jgi:anti-sigma regulatory factor (Ser/Thr protein kinase)
MTEVATPSMVLVPADLASVAVVRAAIEQSLVERGWHDDAIHRVVLATTEATANAVEHGSLPGELVEVLYTVGAFEASVRVFDSGGTTPWAPPTIFVMPEPSAPRGRGLALIAAMARTFRVARSGQGVEVRMDFARTA